MKAGTKAPDSVNERPEGAVKTCEGTTEKVSAQCGDQPVDPGNLGSKTDFAYLPFPPELQHCSPGAAGNPPHFARILPHSVGSCRSVTRFLIECKEALVQPR